MTSPFDPYHRWLGIHPDEQPADQYRLLGLRRFEQDAEVIRDAAERQMAHVRRYAVGEHAEAARRLLNELGSAKACLLVETKKRSYDASLEGGGVATPHANPPADATRSDRPGTRQTAPIPLELIEPEVQVGATSSDVDRPLRPNTSTPAARRPTLAQMQALQHKPSTIPSGRQLIRQADDILKRIAGDGNELLHGFLRTCAIAGAIFVPVACGLVAVPWVIHRTQSAVETLAIPGESTSIPIQTSPLPPLVLSPIDGLQVNEGTKLLHEFKLAGTSNSAGSVLFEFVGETHGAILEPRGVFTWTPTEAQGPGEFKLQVRAIDASNAAQPRVSEPLAFQVMVGEVNQPPRFEPSNEQQVEQVTVGDELKLTLQATDPDIPENNLAYKLVDKPANSYLDPRTGEFRWTPANSDANGGFVDLVVEVTDNESHSARQTIQINVRPKPNAPASAEISAPSPPPLAPKEPVRSVENITATPLKAPILLSPKDRTLLGNYPRKNIMEWTSVAGVTRYKVQIQFFVGPRGQLGPVCDFEANTNRFENDLNGNRPKRWRVGATDASGQETAWSDWWEFRYAR